MLVEIEISTVVGIGRYEEFIWAQVVIPKIHDDAFLPQSPHEGL